MSTTKAKSRDVSKHSAAHVLATAVKRLYPDVKVGIGPVTKDGFYYDFNFGNDEPNISLEEVEKIANEIVKEDLEFKQLILPREEAYNMLLQMGQIFKAELIQAIPDQEVSFFNLGNEFIDLCRGPHVNSTSQIGIIKILGKDHAFWKDDPSRPQMVRIFGNVFNTENEYKEFQTLQSTLKQRDFVSIGRRLGLLIGNPVARNLYVSESGSTILQQIANIINAEFLKEDVEEVMIFAGLKAGEVSEVLNMDFNLKNRSYKNLPVTYSTRILLPQKFTKYDLLGESMIFKTFTNKISSIQESTGVINKIINVVKAFAGENLTVEIYCPNLDSEFVKAISNFLQKNLIAHNKILSGKVKGEAVVKVIATDSIKQPWEFVDVNIGYESNSFFYTGGNKKENPVSIEVKFNNLNMFAYIVEEFKEQLPYNLAPVQIICIPTSNKYLDFGNEVEKSLKSIGFRVVLDNTSRSFKSKIKSAETKKIPYIFIIGNKEEQNKAIAVRKSGAEIGLVSIQNVKEFIEENNNKV